MDYAKNLEDLGLTPNEARIYYSLLKLKHGSIDGIAKSANIHRRNVYDTLERLQQKGLIHQVVSSKTLLFSPVEPEKLNEIVQEKQNSLNMILPALNKIFKEDELPQTAVVYKGVGGLKSYIRLVLKTNETNYTIGGKGSWFDPRIVKFVISAEKKWREQKQKSCDIFDAEIKKYPEVPKYIGGKFKYLPKKYSSKSQIDIFGDYVAIYSGIGPKGFDDEISIFVLKDKQMAADYKKWFQLLWDLLPNN
jgi:predicted DNA-binding transcriptional regulator